MPKVATTLPTSRFLVRQSFADAWKHRRLLAAAILLIMVPVSLITLSIGSDSPLTSYGSLATLVMNLAVLYGVVIIKHDKAPKTVAELYYAGTTRFVAFVAVIGLLTLMMIPFMIGALVYMSGSSGATVGLSGGDIVVLGGLWLLIAFPSFRWLTRSVFALYIVQDPTTRPVAAVKQSSALVRGRSWRVAGRLAVALLVAAIILIVPSLAISTLPASASWFAKIATAVLQIISSLLLVPFVSFYGYNLLEALRGRQK